MPEVLGFLLLQDANILEIRVDGFYGIVKVLCIELFPLLKMANFMVREFHVNKLFFKQKKKAFFFLKAEKLGWDETFPGTEIKVLVGLFIVRT